MYAVFNEELVYTYRFFTICFLNSRYNLRSTKSGASTFYDPRIDPTLPNAVASAGLFFFTALTLKISDTMESRLTAKSSDRSTFSTFYAHQGLHEIGAISRLITSATGKR